MSGVAYAAALVLALLFAWAGAAKLGNREATATTFSAMGVPGSRVAATVVPVFELALAAALVMVPRVAAVVTIAALVAFTAVLVRAMRAGVEVGCACFGTARTAPVSGVEVTRNLFMVGGAVIVLGTGGPTAPELEAVVVVTTGVAVVAVVLALADLGRRTGQVLRIDLGAGPGGEVDR